MTQNQTPLEEVESQHFATWLAYNNFKFTHIANESQRPSTKWAFIVAAKKRKMGVSRGFPDFLILLPDQGIAFVEMKRIKGGQVSAEQKDWIDAINAIPNCEAKICTGADNAISFIQSLTKNK